MALVTDYLYAKASLKKIPLSCTFELSPVCNFSCKMCYVRKTLEQIYKENKRVRTYEEWLELAKQLKEAGTLYILLTGGEPFAYPHFKELYCTLHDMGFVLSINSNGTLITEEVLEWLKEKAPSRINITLYGASPETYERICQNRAGYEMATAAIDRLVAAHIPVVINTSMTPENEMDLEDIFAFGKARKLNVRCAGYMFPPVRRDTENSDSRLTPMQTAQISIRRQKALLDYDEEKFKQFCRSELDLLKKETEEGADFWGVNTELMYCRAGKSTCWISWDGKMTACGLSQFPLVEYPFEKPYLECWMNLTNTVREKTVMAECQGCKKKGLCRPCVAMMTAETGSPDQKAPYLCEMTDCTIELLKKELGEK